MFCDCSGLDGGNGGGGCVWKPKIPQNSHKSLPIFD